MNDVQKDLIYLLSCAVNGLAPDKERVQAMDLGQLYQLAKFHTVSAAVCIALERAGVEEEQFIQALNKAIRKNIFLDIERKSITEELDKRGIWYMPLKGAIIKELYPENGMREMADNDMLYDRTKQAEVRELMLGMGYTAKSVGRDNQDVYMKPPVLNFELHTDLFSFGHTEFLYNYYADTRRLLLKDDDNSCGYHFSDEDFYVYMTAHEWKHHSRGGTGVRSLYDCYVYCKVKGSSLDWDYIKEQCRQLKIAGFEIKRRRLAMKVFSSDKLPALTESEQELLMMYLTAGAYGTFENRIKKKLQGQSKLSFCLHSIFIPRRQMNVSVPFTAKSPLLYPVGAVCHSIRMLIFKRDRIKQAIKVLKENDK